MLKKLPCPWCGESLALSHPGVRRVRREDLPSLERILLVCPYCNRGVAKDKKSQRWLLLGAPLFGVVVWRAWTMGLPWTQWLLGFGPFEIGMIALAGVGTFMQWRTERYEKAE